MTTPVLFEPASAIAAGLCLAARAISDGRTARHPRPCGWCDYPLVDLRAMVAGFNEWAGFSERTHTYERHDARVFAELRPADQAALVLEAQAFPDLEEGPSWLR